MAPHKSLLDGITYERAPEGVDFKLGSLEGNIVEVNRLTDSTDPYIIKVTINEPPECRREHVVTMESGYPFPWNKAVQEVREAKNS